MDALHPRGNPSNATTVTTPRVGRAIRPRHPLGRAWLGAGICGVGLVISAWFNFVELPLTVTVAGAGESAVVHSVGVGSNAWVAGVRPLMPVERGEAGAFHVVTKSGVNVGLVAHQRGDFQLNLLAGTLLVAAAFVVRAARLPGAAAAAGAGVAISLAPALRELGFPAALPLMLLSAAAAIALVRIPDRRTQLRFDLFGLAALAVIVGVALLLARNPLGVAWFAVWAAPLPIAICLGIAGDSVAARSRWRTIAMADAGRRARFLAAVVPLVANSRLDGAEEERSRLAIDLHNRVLPNVRSSARATGTETTADVAERLGRVEADLREVMQRHETVTLETGGLFGALRVHVAAIDTSGVRVAFEVSDEDAGRPPAKVELAAYRIGQAAIDNAIRHSGADRVGVAIAVSRDRVDLTVRDDGVGLDDAAQATAHERGRIGLAQMRLRAEAVGGALEIVGRPGQGTEIRFAWMRR